MVIDKRLDGVVNNYGLAISSRSLTMQYIQSGETNDANPNPSIPGISSIYYNTNIAAPINIKGNLFVETVNGKNGSKKSIDGTNGGDVCLYNSPVPIEIYGISLVKTGKGGNGLSSKVVGGNGGDGGNLYIDSSEVQEDCLTFVGGQGGEGGSGIVEGKDGVSGTRQEPPLLTCCAFEAI